MPRRGERTNQLRCRQLPQLNERDGTDRLHALSGWLRLLHRSHHVHTMRAWYRDSKQRAELMCSMHCRLVSVCERLHGMH